MSPTSLNRHQSANTSIPENEEDGKAYDSVLEFPKRDVFIKIDKKDLVFIYEVDDII